jgi:hypothetical protein
MRTDDDPNSPNGTTISFELPELQPKARVSPVRYPAQILMVSSLQIDIGIPPSAIASRQQVRFLAQNMMVSLRQIIGSIMIYRLAPGLPSHLAGHQLECEARA